VRPHTINAYYLGWTGDGHFGGFNVNHAFYQVLGNDTFNQLANRRIKLNAQMAALELSVDKDWKRYRPQFFMPLVIRIRRTIRAGFRHYFGPNRFAGGRLASGICRASK